MKTRLYCGLPVAVMLCMAIAVIAPNEILAAGDGETAKKSGSLEGAVNTETPTTSGYMRLGTPGGPMGGTEMLKYDRNKIKSQILTFIPPLLRPAFVQHAFVLPPNVFAVNVAERFTSLTGTDYNKDGAENLAVFKDARVERNLTDFNVLYGFDLDHKYLHSFTVKVNVPYLSSRVSGEVHPHGQQFIGIENAGSTQEIGDVSIFLKKKILEQGNWPIGLAIVGGVTLPTGDNRQKFGDNGRVTARRPQPPTAAFLESKGVPAAQASAIAAAAAQGFDEIMKLRGDGKCFFGNTNAGCAMGAFGVPAGPPANPNGPLTFAPGGANAGNQFIGDFPFNNGVFGRFADDGRLPSPLQPGTNGVSYTAGLFMTRQFEPGAFPGRSALHMGVAHRFVTKHDGVDPGDTTTYFASYVRPIYKDFLALDLAVVAKRHFSDSYDGKIPIPGIHNCAAGEVFQAPFGAVGCGMAGAPPVGTPIFGFNLMNRPAFSAGTTGLFAPSLIFSPDPQIRMTVSGLVRIHKPHLGPSPPWVVRASLEALF